MKTIRKSSPSDKIDLAIFEVQQVVPFVDKTDTAKIEGRTVEYQYKFVPIELVWHKLREPCTSQRLSVVQATGTNEKGEAVLSTLVTHVDSGQWQETDIPLAALNPKSPTQSLGASLSYCRRVGLLAAFGVVAKDEDKDAVDEMAGRRAEPRRMNKEARSAAPPPISAGELEEAINAIPHIEDNAELSKLWGTIKGALEGDRKTDVYNRIKARAQEIKAMSEGAKA